MSLNTRPSPAVFVLLAAAFVLAGLVLVTAQHKLAPRADADLVIAQQDITYLTARVRNNADGLFVLDNSTGILSVYMLDVGKGQLELAGQADVNRIFGGN